MRLAKAGMRDAPAASSRTGLASTNLLAREAFELARCPSECRLHCFALGVAYDHFWHDGLARNLNCYQRRRRRADDGTLLVAAFDWIVRQSPHGRPVLVPRLEVIEIGVRRQIIALTGGHLPFRCLTTCQMQQ